MDRFKRVEISYLDPIERIKNFKEVCLGYTEEEAVLEAKRCLQCKNPKCVPLCPVNIDIPGFIKAISQRDFLLAYEILSDYTSLPAVCGRVCPQEDQCEKTCILGIKGDPIAIGKLERFAADWALENNIRREFTFDKKNKKVAIVGSGPAGISCAGELIKLGYEVTIFESLHQPGGVLIYGIPEFRLPNEKVVFKEIENLERLGVKIEKNVYVGRTLTIKDIFNEGFEAIFIASGAGAPIFMGIDGENLNNVFSANEFLTRNNLMNAYKSNAQTQIYVGKNIAVIGGGNVAMDAARTAKRYGAEVNIIYRRTKAELPARYEEVENAIEEGIKFHFLVNPIEILGNEFGEVSSIKLQKMKLGEPDSSGRRKPMPIAGEETELKVDTVIMALGTNPNTVIADTASGLKLDAKNRILVDKNLETKLSRVFAGGDIVTGSATVILAMGAGKKAAHSIDNLLNNKAD
ncbi:MAG: NADPH-dependent glutamate synthase [Tissierellia bacterium]|nr:NADPH-dependent glutamate synthase [Tissierellia bacterium]